MILHRCGVDVGEDDQDHALSGNDCLIKREDFTEERTTMRLKKLVLCSCILMLSACATWRKLNVTEKGAVIGGGSGAVIGNIVAPGVGGTVVGGALGAAGGGLIGHEQDNKRKNRY